MGRASTRIAIALVVLIALVTGSAPSGASRAVSMRVLQSKLKSGQPGEAATLCGLTRVTGYVVDQKSRDIILVGEVDPKLPRLYAEDLVTALKNVNMVYARTVGNMRYYSPPGCSIDPNPKVIQQVREVLNRLSSTRDINARKQGIAEFESVGSQPQNVRVMGVPFNSRFASVMVDADYYMKRLSNGSEALGIDRFESVMDMRMRLWQANQNDREAQSVFSVSRLWFSPGESSYTDDGEAVTLNECRVQLLTEEEFVKSTGELSGTGRPDPLAQAFARGFTDCYQEIASARPIYRELEGLYRFVALAGIMSDRKATSAAGLDLGYLIGEYGAPRVSVSHALNGITRVQEMDTQDTNGNGDRVMRFRSLLSCGGVRMDPHPKRLVGQSEARGPNGSSMGKSVIHARTSKDALSWDYTIAATPS